jgi:hypothetical protein
VGEAGEAGEPVARDAEFPRAVSARLAIRGNVSGRASGTVGTTVGVPVDVVRPAGGWVPVVRGGGAADAPALGGLGRAGAALGCPVSVAARAPGAADATGAMPCVGAESVTGAETGGGAGTGADATVVGDVLVSDATAAGDVPSGIAR